MSAQRFQTKTRVTLASTTVDTLYEAPCLDGGDYYLAKAYALPHDTTALHATDYASIAIKAGSTALGTLTSETVAFTAGTLREFSLSGAGRKVTGQSGALNIAVTKPGGAVAIDLDVICVWEKIR